MIGIDPREKVEKLLKQGKMSTNTYKWIAGVLAVIVIGLLVYIVTRPKEVDTTALNNDLSQFSVELQQWNATYSANPTPAAQQKLSQELGDFSNKLKSDSGQ